MKKYVKSQLKESFLNIQFIIIFIVLIISLIISISNKSEFFIYLFLGCTFLVILFIIGFFRRIKMRKNLGEVKNGKLKYEPYTININQFIEECKMGLMYSLVKINNEIYELETQPDEVNSKKFDNFICYINEKEIKGVDNFLNYKFDNVHSLKDLKEISFLEYNNADPKKYFVEKTIDL